MSEPTFNCIKNCYYSSKCNEASRHIACMHFKPKTDDMKAVIESIRVESFSRIIERMDDYDEET